MPDNLNARQKHLVVVDDECNAHVIPAYLVRRVATGKHIPDNELTRLIARALVDFIEDEI